MKLTSDDVGKTFRTRDGQQAEIVYFDPTTGRLAPVLAVIISDDGRSKTAYWYTATGIWNASRELWGECHLDLVPPIRALTATLVMNGDNGDCVCLVASSSAVGLVGEGWAASTIEVSVQEDRILAVRQLDTPYDAGERNFWLCVRGSQLVLRTVEPDVGEGYDATARISVKRAYDRVVGVKLG